MIPGVRITSCSDSFVGSLGWCLITPPWSPRGARGNTVRPQVSKELQPGEGGPAHLPERPCSAPAFGQSSAPTKYSSGVLALDGLATVYVGGHCRPPCCAPYPEDKQPRFTRVLPKRGPHSPEVTMDIYPTGAMPPGLQLSQGARPHASPAGCPFLSPRYAGTRGRGGPVPKPRVHRGTTGWSTRDEARQGVLLLESRPLPPQHDRPQGSLRTEMVHSGW